MARPAAIVLGCVKGKASSARPARDLYRSPLWQRRRAYAEAAGVPWSIFSAKHGLLDPDTVIEPYDVSMAHLRADTRRALGRQAAAALADRLGGVAGKTIEVHAGARYVAAISAPLESMGATIMLPVAGRSIGQQLHWYATQAG